MNHGNEYINYMVTIVPSKIAYSNEFLGEAILSILQNIYS